MRVIALRKENVKSSPVSLTGIGDIGKNGQVAVCPVERDKRHEADFVTTHLLLTEESLAVDMDLKNHIAYKRNVPQEGVGGNGEPGVHAL